MQRGQTTNANTNKQANKKQASKQTHKQANKQTSKQTKKQITDNVVHQHTKDTNLPDISLQHLPHEHSYGCQCFGTDSE